MKAINGCFTTTYTLDQIIIRKKPTADFGTSAQSLCVNTPVCFTNQTINGYSGNSCNTATTFTWDFGDGTTSNAQNPPCHAYSTPGTYNITLTASNTSCGSDTRTKQIIVLPISQPPVVSATPVVYCQGQPAIPLTATGTGLLWYQSATGGVGNATAPTPSTNTPGTFTWYVSQTFAGNCESPRVPLTVTVNPIPAAPTTSPLQLCQNQTASPLTASGANLLWYTSQTGGTGSAVPPTPSTASVGSITYYVSQTVNGCEGPRAPLVVSIITLPQAPIVTSPITYCQNQAALPLSASGSGLLWYTVASGGTGSATIPVPSTATPGTTTWYVSQSSSCGESPRTPLTVIVNPGPSASISYNPVILCNVVNSPSTPNLPVSVTQTGTGGGSFSVAPSSGLSINPSTGEINPSGAVAGVYTIKYTIAGSGGCATFTTTATVTVSGTPNATISYPPICSSDPVKNVSLTGTQGGSFTSTAGLTIDPATGAITPSTSTPGTYSVSYIILPSVPCPGFNITTNVTITQAPAATISYSPAILCNVINSASTPNPTVAVTHTGTTGGNYTISPQSGLTINSVTGEINPSGAIAGVYTIRYTVVGSGGCANYSTTTSVAVNGAPTATIQYPASPFCTGTNALQSVSLSGSSGGTYTAGQGLSINPATGQINPAQSTPGNYTVTYTIAASAPCPGYVATTSVQINESPTLSFQISSQSICSGGTATFVPTSTVANTVYSWKVLGSLPAGVTGVSTGSVSGTNPVISLSFVNSGNNTQALTIQVTPTNPVQSSCAGATFNLTLNVNPIPPAPVTDTVNICMGAAPVTLHVNPIPGNTIKWYDQNLVPLNAAPVVNTVIAGTVIYYVSQTNMYGCESPKAELVAVVHTTFKITGASFTNPTSCGIPSGSILLDVVDLNNTIIPNFPVVVHLNKFQTPLTIVAKTNAQGKVVIPLTAGTYSGIYVETSIGCFSQNIPDIFILKDPTPPAQPVAGYNPPICSENPLVLTALSPASSQQGPIDYVWAGPAFGPLADTIRNSVVTFPSAPMSFAGTYVVYAIQNNCISLATTITVAIKQSPTKPVITTRTPLCVGDDLVLQAYSSIPVNAIINYEWRGPGRGFPVNQPNAGINNVRVEDGGIYTITVTSPQTGCSSTKDTLIQIGGYPIVKFAQDTVTLPTGYLLNLATVIINKNQPGILPIKNYAWMPSQDIKCNDAICSSPVLTVKENACYAVKVTNIYGCSGSDTMCVKVFCKSSQVFVANAFLPRGDIPENTRVVVKATGISMVNSFKIFNRWGRVVFERSKFPPNSFEYGWDGKLNGRFADTGVYVYIVEVTCENGIVYSYKGNVTLF